MTAQYEGIQSEEDDDEDEESRRLSILRLIAALVVVIALIGAVGFTTKRAVSDITSTSKVGSVWFGPYVDTTLTPTYEFQSPSTDPARQVVLGFIVAAQGKSCVPSWGNYDTPAQAAQSLNLDRRIAQVRSNGGDVIVSFGGQANTELADYCPNVTDLERAYRSVIDRYQVTTVDFDIEGTALSDAGGIKRRAEALAQIQQAARDAGHQLAIWLTLPAEPDGLQGNALSVVTAMVRGRVDLAGVNVMTMDFSRPQPKMLSAVEQSLISARSQVAKIYKSYGIDLTATQAWSKIGATPMIGQNDTDGEMFDLADARALVAFASSHRLGRVSMWSLNRDRQCGSEFAQLYVHSTTCSGTSQAILGFTNVFDQLNGSAQANSAERTRLPATPSPIDNPATSPYPIWQPGASYIAGYLVVREGYVYQAKWYNQGDDPAEQTQFSYETPWELVGPVLPNDRAPTPTTLPASSFPAWSPTTAYSTGEEVLRDGLPYTAKYYNQDSDPLAAAQGNPNSPWNLDYTVPGEPNASG